MRKHVNKRVDKKKFKQNAINTKVINLVPTVYRGGIRL